MDAVITQAVVRDIPLRAPGEIMDAVLTQAAVFDLSLGVYSTMLDGGHGVDPDVRPLGL